MEESCGWKYDPNLILQEVLVEITGKFKFLIVFSRFFQMFSHVFWLDGETWKKTPCRLFYCLKNPNVSCNEWYFKDIIWSLIIAVRALKKGQQKVSAFNSRENLLFIQNNKFCLQSLKFAVKYFLKPAEISGDCIFYLNGQRVWVNVFMYNRDICKFFPPKKFLNLDVLKAVKPFLLLVGFRKILNYTEQMLKQMDTVFWKSGKNIWLENVILLFLLNFSSWKSYERLFFMS